MLIDQYLDIAVTGGFVGQSRFEANIVGTFSGTPVSDCVVYHTIVATKPQPQAEMLSSGTVFSGGDNLILKFRLNQPVNWPFKVFAVIFMPDGSILDLLKLKPLVINKNTGPVPAATGASFGAPFEFTFFNGIIPRGVPKGSYNAAVLFFGASDVITGRDAARIDANTSFIVR